MSDSSLRLLILLKQISRVPMFISSQDLHQRMQDHGFSVSLRTIQRDLAALSAHFPLVNNQPTGVGKTGVGWAFARNSQNLSLPVMGTAAALTFSMAMQHLQQLLPQQAMQHLLPYRQEAEQLLAIQDSKQFQNWTSKVRVVPQHFLQPPQLDDVNVVLIYQALLENRQFRASYKHIDDRIIHPYGLVQQGHTMYLLCRFYDFDDIRITALQRFANVQLLEDAVRPFPEFNIDDYLQQGVMQWPVAQHQKLSLVMRTNENLAYHLTETPLATDQHLCADHNKPDCFILSATVLDSYQLRYWLLGQCDQLEIMQPASLRSWMTEVIRDQAQKYLHDPAGQA